MVQMARDAEHVKLPMKATLQVPAIVCTDGSDVKPSEDDVVGNMVLQQHLRSGRNQYYQCIMGYTWNTTLSKDIVQIM